MIRTVPSQVIEFIDSCFPWASGESINIRLRFRERGNLASLIEMIDCIPAELISLGTESTVEFISALATIRIGIRIWEGGTADSQIVSLEPFGNLNAVSLIRRALSHCPDELPAPETVELQFINDEQLRESIRLDISTANQDLVAGEAKASTVMAGSAVEALLLWALQEKTELVRRRQAAQALKDSGVLNKKPAEDINRWDLREFIEVAFHLNIINSDTAAQARLAQNFRNLIHPGRAIRLGQTCDRATALTAVAAIAHVTRDLAERYGPA